MIRTTRRRGQKGENEKDDCGEGEQEDEKGKRREDKTEDEKDT